MIDSQLLEILVCPETHQALVPAGADVVARLNAEIAAGRLKNRAGKNISEKIDAGLIRADGKFLYLVRDEIPVMLIDEAIALA
jgi:uncharacterized protein YbaR (Trm112 family)